MSKASKWRMEQNKLREENKASKPLKAKMKVGAPNKPRDEKKDPNTGLTQLQKDWVQKEADERRLSRTDIMREAIEMYITAVESQREELPIENTKEK